MGLDPQAAWAEWKALCRWAQRGPPSPTAPCTTCPTAYPHHPLSLPRIAAAAPSVSATQPRLCCARTTPQCTAPQGLPAI
jgi:hypothetical protein